MKIPKTITPKWALDSLRSTACPHCEGPKGSGKSLCFKAFGELPAEMKRALYLRIGRGYEAALDDALKHLQTPAEAK